MPENSFDARSTLTVCGREYEIFGLDALLTWLVCRTVAATAEIRSLRSPRRWPPRRIASLPSRFRSAAQPIAAQGLDLAPRRLQHSLMARNITQPRRTGTIGQRIRHRERRQALRDNLGLGPRTHPSTRSGLRTTSTYLRHHLHVPADSETFLFWAVRRLLTACDGLRIASSAI